MHTIETSYEELVQIGSELTRQTALAERERDFRKVEELLRKKDQLHRLRKELSDACR